MHVFLLASDKAHMHDAFYDCGRDREVVGTVVGIELMTFTHYTWSSNQGCQLFLVVPPVTGGTSPVKSKKKSMIPVSDFSQISLKFMEKVPVFI